MRFLRECGRRVLQGLTTLREVTRSRSWNEPHGLFQSAPPDAPSRWRQPLQRPAPGLSGNRRSCRACGGTVAGRAVVPALAARTWPTSRWLAGPYAGDWSSRIASATRALVVPERSPSVAHPLREVPRHSDLLELVRWQVRKSATVPARTSVVSYTPGGKPAEGGQELASASRELT